MPSRATPDAIDDIVDLIVRQQARADRHVPSLGTERAGLVAELEDLEPPWTESVRITRDGEGRIVGAVVAEWDSVVSKAWIHGPWIDIDDEPWIEVAEPLVRSACAQVPGDISSFVLSGDVAHRCLAVLAERMAWSTGEVNHVLAIDAATVGTWGVADPTRSRDVNAGDIEALLLLHDAEFTGTYFSARQLVERSLDGEHVVLVVDGHDGLVGYVAGRIQPDGEAYIDFLAVDPNRRCRGVGRELIVDIARRLVPLSSTERLCLTVQDGRTAARTLYESLGFVVDASIVGYMSGSTS